jgi:hypothetical protein
MPPKITIKPPARPFVLPRKAAPPPPEPEESVYTVETVPSEDEDPQPEMSDGKAYAAWCMRQRLRKQKARTVVSGPNYTVDTVPTEAEDPMPTQGGPGYNAWCVRQKLRRAQRVLYGSNLNGDHIRRGRLLLISQLLKHLWEIGEQARENSFAPVHEEFGVDDVEAWLDHKSHAAFKRLV